MKENDNLSFFVAWNRNLTSEFVLTHNFGYKTHIFGIRRISEIKISNHLAVITVFRFTSGFSGNSGQVWNYFKRVHQAISYHMEKPFDDISNLWHVIWSSVLYYLEETLPYSKMTSLYSQTVSFALVDIMIYESIFPRYITANTFANPGLVGFINK